jgi:hypothetical protein
MSREVIKNREFLFPGKDDPAPGIFLLQPIEIGGETNFTIVKQLLNFLLTERKRKSASI